MKFLISEEEKSRILGMHQNATSKFYLNEATTVYDPWKDFNSGGKGLKFKSQADWENFINLIPTISFTSAEGASFPHIMEKNASGQYVLKVFQTTGGSTNAVPSIQVMGLTLFYIASANSLKNLNIFANQSNVSVYYNKVASFLNQMIQPATSLGSPMGLVDKIGSDTNKTFSAVKKDWSNIITLKLAPIYKQRYDAYASAPIQK